MTESIRREIVFPQPPDDVWQALTDSETLAQWLMPNYFEPAAGCRFTFRTQPNPRAGFDGTVHWEVLECEPSARLAYTWAGGGIDTTVTCSLEPDGDGARLHFAQSGFDASKPYGDAAIKGAEYGWTRMFEALTNVLAAPLN